MTKDNDNQQKKEEHEGYKYHHIELQLVSTTIERLAGRVEHFHLRNGNVRPSPWIPINRLSHKDPLLTIITIKRQLQKLSVVSKLSCPRSIKSILPQIYPLHHVHDVTYQALLPLLSATLKGGREGLETRLSVAPLFL